MTLAPLPRDYFPMNVWRESSPAAQQMEESLLCTVDDLIRADYPTTHGFLVVRHGYIVFERYYGGFHQDRKHEVRSITKSVISALIGIALKEGYLTSLDQKVADLLPEYIQPDADPRIKDVTLRHLLTMTAGFDCDDTDSNFWLMRQHHDWGAAALAMPLVNTPGEGFVYDSAAMHLLSVILTRLTGMNAFEYAQSRLFQPLGMDVDRWPADPQGNSEGAVGLVMTPRDMAKFGYLYLNGGSWDGQQIIPEWYVRESTRKHSAGGNPEPAEYGYLWWVMPPQRHPGYCAAGYGGQYIFVFPNRDLVVVLSGDHTLMASPEAPVPLLFQYVIPAAHKDSA